MNPSKRALTSSRATVLLSAVAVLASVRCGSSQDASPAGGSNGQVDASTGSAHVGDASGGGAGGGDTSTPPTVQPDAAGIGVEDTGTGGPADSSSGPADASGSPVDAGGSADAGRGGGGRPDAGTDSGGGVAAGPDAGVDSGAGTVATAPINVWMAGDSTMQLCSDPCPCGWGSQFAPYFNSLAKVQDDAVGGRSIQTWLYEGAVSDTIGADGECVLTSTTYDPRWTNMLAGMKTGDYFFVDFGINDGDPTCPRHVGTARFQTLMTTMVQAAQSRGVHPIVLTPTDAIICNGNTVTANRGFLPQGKAVAAATGATLIDLNQLTIGLYTSLGFCPNDADYTSTTSALGLFFCDDHTHFEAAGATQVAGLVSNAIKAQQLPLAQYLK